MNRNNILRISTITALGVALMTNATVGQSAKSDKLDRNLDACLDNVR